MRPRDDLTGMRFSRLVVLREAQKTRIGRWEWWCRCDCGTEKAIIAAKLKNGAIRSCGCLQKEVAANLRTKPVKGETYFTGKPCKRGHVSLRRVKGKVCIECAKQADAGRLERDPDMFTRYRAKWIKADPIRQMLKKARSSANARGLECALTPEDINIPKHCPCCQRELSFNTARWKSNSYSIDRIDSTKGYIRGNVAVICYRCNMLKSNATADELSMIAKWIRSASR